ncbi:AraC family transcriptional regulator [Pedobacter sp. Leaf176]|uniref:helix-turn-helix domain-containing protein n=1 Tax=Pedobacter sp. Leaf176 TaxID=1736286 RepID=UPI0006FDF21A|nr:AraC family transcriptional regulator [Pedobacter sp. Leaf176]KQR66850.1 hypothetical protein ASF92_19040 [Pedobacter sp. Leaf176]
MAGRFNSHTYSLLNIDRVELTAKWRYSGIISPYSRIYYISEGDGQLTDSTGNTTLESGFLYLIPGFTMCDMSCGGKLTQYYVQFFDDSGTGLSIFDDIRTIQKIPASELDIQLFIRLLKIHPYRGIKKSYDPKRYENETFYNNCLHANAEQSTASFHETQGILQQLCSRFLNNKGRAFVKQNLHAKKMTDVVHYILSNLESDLSVAKLANKVSQNVDYFSRRFKSHTGMRPNHFINQKRIERAQYLLATSALNYSEIAAVLGYDNLSYFSKNFKKMTGLSPGAYKKQIYVSG